MYGKTLRIGNISVTANVKTDGDRKINGRDRVTGINMMNCHIYNKTQGYKELADLKRKFGGKPYSELLKEAK